MAYESPLFTITRKSSGDMSTHQYKLVTFSTTNDAEGCILGPATAGGRAHGVWLGTSTAAEFGSVQMLGVCRVAISTASGTIVNGSPLTGSTVSGLGHVQLATSTAGSQNVIGFALEAIANGTTGVIAAFLTPAALKDDVTA